MSLGEIRRQRDRALEQYTLFRMLTRESAASCGRDSESCRANDRSAMLWLGRYNAYTEMVLSMVAP